MLANDGDPHQVRLGGAGHQWQTKLETQDKRNMEDRRKVNRRSSDRAFGTGVTDDGNHGSTELQPHLCFLKRLLRIGSAGEEQRAKRPEAELECDGTTQKLICEQLRKSNGASFFTPLWGNE